MKAFYKDIADQERDSRLVRLEEEEQKKIEQEKKRQRDAYKLRKRAEKVGLKPLKGGRPTGYDRKRWLKELEKREANPLPSPQT